MLVNTMEIENKVLGALKNDATLSGYVKSFSQGDMNISRKLFPFIEVGNFVYREKQLLAASGIFLYTVNIYAGTGSLAPGVAFRGGSSGAKGIADLCNDIAAVIRNNRFSGAFFKPVRDVKVDPRYRFNRPETICIGKVSFSGEVWFMHR